MFFLGRSVRRWKAFMACGLLFGLLICIVPRLAVGSETAPSLTRMTGQMLLVGFRGQSPEECTNVLADIRKRGLGGVILFRTDAQRKERRNILDAGQVRRLTAALRKESHDLFVAVDQEGGRVARFHPQDGFPAFPSAEALGRQTSGEAEGTGFRMGRLLRSLGVNVNFAPVLDVNVNPSCPVIGALGRSFGEDPERVAEYGRAFAKGLSRAGVVAVFKHFPGHGSSRTDSHLGVTDISGSWSERELLPYRRLATASGLHMLMTGHLYNRQLDSDRPATLSAATIDGLLRKTLRYDGVVVTDDLQMRAIADAYSLRETVLGAIEAGADILLFGNNIVYDPDIVARVQAIIAQAVEDGALSRQRIEKSWLRIQRLKRALAESGLES